MDVTLMGSLSKCNRAAIETSGQASCYFCRTVFDSQAVEMWADEGHTAVCPHCGMDSVVPGTVDPASLKAAHNHWFCGDPE